MTLKARFKSWRQSAEEWEAENPVLLKDEQGFEADTGKWKFGDGTTAWNDLEYGMPAGLGSDDARVGDLADLTTDDKSTVVAAINEANGNAANYALMYTNAKMG